MQGQSSENRSEQEVELETGGGKYFSCMDSILFPSSKLSFCEYILFVCSRSLFLLCRSTIFVFAYPSSIFRDSISAFSGVKLDTFWVYLGFLALLGGGRGGGGANGRAEGLREEAGVGATDAKEEEATVLIAWEVVSSVVEEDNVDGRTDPVTLLERVEAVVTVEGMVKAGVRAEDEDSEDEDVAAEGLPGS